MRDIFCLPLRGLWDEVEKIAIVFGQYFRSNMTICCRSTKIHARKTGEFFLKGLCSRWGIRIRWAGTQGNWVEINNSKCRELWNTIMCAELNALSMIVAWAVRIANKYEEQSGSQKVKLSNAEFVISLISNKVSWGLPEGKICNCFCIFVIIVDNRNVYLTVLEAEYSKIMDPADSVSYEALLFAS